VGDEDGTLGHFDHSLGDFVKFGGIFHHFPADAGQFGDPIGNGAFRIQEGFKTIQYALSIVQNYSDFRNFIAGGPASGGFYVDDRVSLGFHTLQNFDNYENLKRFETLWL